MHGNLDRRALAGVLDRVVEEVVDDLVEPFRVGPDRPQAGRRAQLQLQASLVRSRPDDLQLLLQERPQVDVGRVDRHLPGLDAGQVEQLLRHPEHPLRLLVDDLGRPGPLLGRLQAAIHEGLAEADQARQGRLELVRDVGQEVSLQGPGALNRLRHPVEGAGHHPDLVPTPDAHPPGVVARGQVLGGSGQLGERAREGAAQEQGKREGDDQGDQARLEEPRQELLHRQRVDRGRGPDQDHPARAERVALGHQRRARGDVRLPVEDDVSLSDRVRLDLPGSQQLDPAADGVVAGGVEEDHVLVGEEQHPVGGPDREQVADAVLEEGATRQLAARARAGCAGGERSRCLALRSEDVVTDRDHLPVEVQLGVVELEGPDQEEAEDAARQQADADDARGREQEPVPKAQAALTSRRYPTPQTVSMEGSLTPAVASFSRTCCTWTSTVRV